VHNRLTVIRGHINKSKAALGCQRKDAGLATAGERDAKTAYIRSLMMNLGKQYSKE
jgi:hypothetical protein